VPAQPVFRLHALDADHGDCLWIEYGEADKPHRVLIDCGTTGTAKRLRPFLDLKAATKPSHELLVITHVDADHIAGALPLVEKASYLDQFREVWFNGRMHLDPASKLEPFGGAQGERLTKALLKQEHRWNTTFKGRSCALKKDGAPQVVDLPGGARVTILSPTWSKLQALIPKWDAEVAAAGLIPTVKPLKPQEAPEGFELLGPPDVEALAKVPFQEDTTTPNGTSIAMLLEFAGKRVLLGADAHPSVLIEAISHLTGGHPLPVDLLKVPHHGSLGNVSKQLLELVACKTALFSSTGAYHGHPTSVAVSRVVKYSPRGVELVFNARSEFNGIWDSDALRGKWGFSTRYATGRDGITVQLL